MPGEVLQGQCLLNLVQCMIRVSHRYEVGAHQRLTQEALGHAAGDTLLTEVTQLLKGHVREGDLLARFGGDEFTRKTGGTGNTSGLIFRSANARTVVSAANSIAWRCPKEPCGNTTSALIAWPVL